MSLEGPRPEALALWKLPADGKNINVLQRELAQAIGEHVAVSGRGCPSRWWKMIRTAAH